MLHCRKNIALAEWRIDRVAPLIWSNDARRARGIAGGVLKAAETMAADSP